MIEFRTYSFSALLTLGFILSCGPRNHAPDIPAIPVGPAFGLADSVYAFSTSAFDPDGDSVAVEFSWGVSATTEKTGFMPGGTPVIRYGKWHRLGNYVVRARALDTRGGVSNWTPDVDIEVVHPDSLPLTPLRPDGPDSVRVGFIEEFSFPTRGPPGESLLLAFDWGDGRVSDRWELSGRAGDTIKMGQAFWKDGDWYVRAMAQDGGQRTFSNWSAGKRTKVRSRSGSGWKQVYDAFAVYSVTATRDGGLAATGETGRERLLLLKLDVTGNTLWRREYDSLWFGGASVRQTDDGGFIVVGSSFSEVGPSGADIARTDEYGELLWSKRYDRFAWGCQVRPTPDQGYVIGAGDVLMKVDYSGESLWAIECGAVDVELTPDQGYVAIGWDKVTKVDTAGNMLWSVTLGGGRVYGNAVGLLTDGGYILAGDSADKALLLKVDATGSPVWWHTYCGAGETWGYDVGTAANGDFLLSGSTGDASYVARTDAQGGLRWQRELSQEGFSAEVLPTAEGGCIVAGADFYDWPFAALFKVDENGGIGPAGYELGHLAGAGIRGVTRTAQRARAERLRSAMRGR